SPKRDSNPHSVSTTGTSSQRVCRSAIRSYATNMRSHLTLPTYEVVRCRREFHLNSRLLAVQNLPQLQLLLVNLDLYFQHTLLVSVEFDCGFVYKHLLSVGFSTEFGQVVVEFGNVGCNCRKRLADHACLPTCSDSSVIIGAIWVGTGVGFKSRPNSSTFFSIASRCSFIRCLAISRSWEISFAFC